MGNTGSKKHETLDKIGDTAVEHDNVDPRSPTPEIVRTPLQNKPGTRHNITKNCDLRKTFECGDGDVEKLIHNNPILTAVIRNHLQSYDPRSPTQDFERTPVIITTKTNDAAKDKFLLRHHTNALETTCNNSDMNVTHDSSQNDTSNYEDAVIISEEMKPKNLLDELLETTDISLIAEDEPFGCSTESQEALEKVIEQPNSPKSHLVLETDFDCIPEGNSNELECNDKDIRYLVDKMSDVSSLDPRSPTYGIERTPLAFVNNDSGSSMSPTKVEELSDDTLIKVLQDANTELRQCRNLNDKNLQCVLIYEDCIDTPKKIKQNTNGCRTPLACVKNKTEENLDKTKVNSPSLKKKADGPPKRTRRVSQIPRLQSLAKLSKSEVSISLTSSGSQKSECENTPPQSHRDIWDEESSIVV